MSADPGMRDHDIATQIGTSQEVVGVLQRTMRDLIAGAHSEGATAHERMYEAIEVSLDEAWKALGDAYDVMMNGDPAEYE